MFVSLQEIKKSELGSEQEIVEVIKQDLYHYFLRFPQYIVFSWNVNTIGILVLQENQPLVESIEQALSMVKKICVPMENRLQWHVAVGDSVERLSMISICYQKVSHYLAYRFWYPDLHVMTSETMENIVTTAADKNIEHVDPSRMDPGIIRDFLSKGENSEIHDFVETYLSAVGEALKSKIFRDYVFLNIRFAISAYVETLGITKEEFWNEIPEEQNQMRIDPGEVDTFFVSVLTKAMEFRDREKADQSKKILRKALDYIDENFDKETLSLNSVASIIGVSANYFSAIFSQSMEKTFIEYVTTKRMEKAKKMLKTTELSSGEIALAVGFKDPHYFSFVLKKHRE